MWQRACQAALWNWDTEGPRNAGESILTLLHFPLDSTQNTDLYSEQHSVQKNFSVKSMNHPCCSPWDRCAVTAMRSTSGARHAQARIDHVALKGGALDRSIRLYAALLDGGRIGALRPSPGQAAAPCPFL